MNDVYVWLGLAPRTPTHSTAPRGPRIGLQLVHPLQQGKSRGKTAAPLLPFQCFRRILPYSGTRWEQNAPLVSDWFHVGIKRRIMFHVGIKKTNRCGSVRLLNYWKKNNFWQKMDWITYLLIKVVSVFLIVCVRYMSKERKKNLVLKLNDILKISW